MNSAEIPVPVSLISTFTVSAVAETWMPISPPASVYFAAFVMTLLKLCTSRARSPMHVQRHETGVP